MQMSITAGIPENEIRRNHSENSKNPEMTEECRDKDSAQIRRKHRDVTGGTRVHENWQKLGMNDTETETRKSRLLKIINIQKHKQKQNTEFQIITERFF